MGIADGGASFVAYLDRMRPLVEDALASASNLPREETPTARDIDVYLYGPLASFTARGGKRVRPVLVLLGAEAVGAEATRALSTAVAIEQFQTAALVHDDVGDKSDLRRGEPCLHVTEGIGLAVNAGDAALVAMSASVLRDAGLSVETRLAVLDELTSMAERTLEGQALDLGWARDGRWDISVDDYRTMAVRKTAHYSAATPLVVGALCGGGTPGQVEALRSFGLAAGLAFQLRDDVLNVVGDAKAQGKDLRSDITEGKRTLIATYALAHLDGERSAELRALLTSGTTDAGELSRAAGLMEASGAIAYAQRCAEKLAGDARGALGSAEIAPDAAATLSSMADYFVGRSS